MRYLSLNLVFLFFLLLFFSSFLSFFYLGILWIFPLIILYVIFLSSLKIKLDYWLIYLTCYLLIIVLSFYSSFEYGLTHITIGIFNYFILPSFFFLMVLYFNKDNLYKIHRFCIYTVTIICAIGVYQFFFDLTLFGILEKYKTSTNWAIIRIGSVLITPQVFAGVVLFSVVSILHFDIYLKYKKSILTIQVFSVLLSGSLSFIMGLVLYLLFKNILNKKNIHLFLIIFFAFCILLSITPVSEHPIFRSFDILRLISENSESVRINRWINSIENTNNIIYGNGLSTASSTIYGEHRYNTESYILQLYFEAGILGLILLFMYLFLANYKNKTSFSSAFAFLSLFLFYNFIVHSLFIVPSFYLWFVLFSNFKLVEKNFDRI